LQRLKLILSETENWIYEADNLPHYHKYYPEFHIEYGDVFEVYDITGERYCGFYINEKASQRKYKIYYHSTVLYESVFLYLDEARVTVSKPTDARFNVEGRKCHYYCFIKDSIEGLMLGLFTHNRYDTSSRGTGEGAFIIFDNTNEKELFENYVSSNLNTYDKINIDFAQRAIKYEIKQEWDIKFCESIARVYQMFLLWKGKQIL
jgi:hypothetical protein